MNEIRDIHEPFIAWLRKLAIPYHRNRPDKRTTAVEGDPDFLVSWMGHCVYIECKVPGNKLSKKQEERIAYIRRAGNKVVIAYSLEECIEATKNVLCVGKKDLPSSQEIGLTTGSDSSADGRSRVQTGGYVPAGQTLSEMQKADRLRRKTRMTLRLPEQTAQGITKTESPRSDTARSEVKSVATPEGPGGPENKPLMQTPRALDGASPIGHTERANLFIANIAGVDWVCKGSGQPGSEAERIRRATPADLINIR